MKTFGFTLKMFNGKVITGQEAFRVRENFGEEFLSHLPRDIFRTNQCARKLSDRKITFIIELLHDFC